MAFDFYKLISDGTLFPTMPAITIDKRDTDKKVLYNKNNNRLDRIAGDIYQDETFWRIILWANPDYYLEFDIPDNTVIRVPFPFNDVRDEVINKILDAIK